MRDGDSFAEEFVKRRLLDIVAVLAIALSATILVLWVLSYLPVPNVSWGDPTISSRYEIGASKGWFSILRVTRLRPIPPSTGAMSNVRGVRARLVRNYAFVHVEVSDVVVNRGDTPNGTVFEVSFWLCWPFLICTCIAAMLGSRLS